QTMKHVKPHSFRLPPTESTRTPQSVANNQRSNSRQRPTNVDTAGSGPRGASTQTQRPHKPPSHSDTLYPAGRKNSMKKPISLTVNGHRASHEVEPRLLLIHFLREH